MKKGAGGSPRSPRSIFTKMKGTRSHGCSEPKRKDQ